MTTAREQIDARVDALADALEGQAFVAAVERLGQELGPEDRSLLRDVLLERAAEEAGFDRALRERALERGWTRRTLAKLERVWGDERADAVAEALEAGPGGEQTLAREVESLRGDRGRAATVLDALSRHKDARVRAWVPGAAVDILDVGARRLVLSMTRDRERAVRDAAVAAVVRLGPEAAKPIVPALRRRLRSPEPEERIPALAALAELGDRESLAVIDDLVEAAESPEERKAAQAAALALRRSG